MEREVVRINNKQVLVVKWNGEYVITTKQLAEIYETSINNINDNFKSNESRFKLGLHFFLLEGVELQEFKKKVTNSNLVEKEENQIYLWTRRGASCHCMILDTEQAWEQYDCLEENYFKQYQSISESNITYQYPISPSVLESATNAARTFERIMKNEGALPYEIVMMARLLFQQAGIEVPSWVVKIPAYEIMAE